METNTVQDACNAIPSLVAAIPKLSKDSDARFAQDLVSFHRRNSTLTERQAPWVGKLIARAEGPTAVNHNQVKTIGDVTALKALFDRAAIHLKAPSVVLSVPDVGMVRVYVAKSNTKYSGRTVVTDFGKFWPHCQDYGFINQEGQFEPRQFVTTPPTLIDTLKDFAADPVKYARAYGKLTGRCCFCRLPLNDARSTAQGYGPICAEKFELPWGERPAEGSVFLASDEIAPQEDDTNPLFEGLES